MPPPPDSDDGPQKIERLVAVLTAIEQWDANYWRKAPPEMYEIVAFEARRDRRVEILSQLRRLIGK